MSDYLTREMLEAAFDKMLEVLDRPDRPLVYCHPIDVPFYSWLSSGKVKTDIPSLIKFFRLWRECKRKMVVGSRQTKYDWSLEGLRKQYTQKLECL